MKNDSGRYYRRRNYISTVDLELATHFNLMIQYNSMESYTNQKRIIDVRTSQINLRSKLAYICLLGPRNSGHNLEHFDNTR